MPFNIDTIAFSDGWNTGTASGLNANAGDIITATIDVTFQELFDADDVRYGGGSSSSLVGFDFSGNQAFELIGASSLESIFPTLYSGDNSTQLIQFTTDLGGGTTTFTLSPSTVNIQGIFANPVIICNEAYSIGTTSATSKIWINESITTCNLDYRLSSTNNSSDYRPTIELSNSSLVPNFSTTSTVLDANDTVTVNTIPFKYNGNYQTGGLTIRGTGLGTYSQSFQIIHTVRCIPVSIYTDGTNRIPAAYASSKYSNLFSSGLSSVSYGFDGSFGDVVSNGVQIPLNFNNIGLNNVYSFGRANNGFDTKYSYSNLSIIRTSDSEVSDVPLVQAKFTVSFDVDNIGDSPFSNGNTKVEVGIENLPSTVLNVEDYEQSYLSDYAQTTLGAVAISGSATGDASCITNYTATFNSTSSITVSFDVEYNSGAITQINNSSAPYFSINVKTQNHTLDYTNNDRVLLNVFRGVGLQDIPLNPVVIDNTVFIPHSFSDISDGVVSTTLDSIPVQDLVCASRFYIDWANRPNLRLNKITNKLVIKNTVTDYEIEVGSYDLNLQGFPLKDGRSPLVDETIVRGFKVPTDEIRNQVRIFNDGTVSDTEYYQFLIPFFVRWEEYKNLLVSNPPAAIIDALEPNNGLNYFIHRFDNIADYDIFFRLTFDSTDSDVSFIQDFDYQLNTNDYEAHADVTARSLKTYSEDGVTELLVDTTNAIDLGQKTKVEARWTMSSIPPLSFITVVFFAEELNNGSPTQIHRISSVNGLFDNSWFENDSNTSKIEVSIDGSDIVGVAYFNNETVNVDNIRIYPMLYSTNQPVEFTFSTEINVPTDGSFNGRVSSSGGEIVTWTLLDGYNETINIFSKTDRTGLTANELNGVCQDVVMTFSTKNPSNITGINFADDNVCGSIDLTLFDSLTSIILNTNPSLDSITNPNSSGLITLYRAQNTNISTIDFLGCNLSGEVDLSACSNLASITNFVSSNIISILRIFNCTSLTTLDLSGLIRLSGDVLIFGNTSMTTVNNPVSTDLITNYSIYSGNLTTLSVNTLNLSGIFRAYSMSNLTTITHQATANTFTVYEINNNSSLTSVNLNLLTGLGGDLQMQNCTSLSSILFPVTTQVFTRILMNNCNFTSIDFGNLSNIGGSINFSSNTSLSSVVNLSSSQTVTNLIGGNTALSTIDISNLTSFTNSGLDVSFNNSDLTVNAVNNILIHLESVLTPLGAGTGDIDLRNQLPSIPTGAGATAKTDLISLGYNVLTD